MTNDTMTTTNVNPSTPTNEHVKYDDKVIKKMVASALMNVDGFLGTSNSVVGNLTAMLQKNTNTEEDIIKGITTDLKDNQVDVNLKIITESGKNIPTIVENIISSVTQSLKDVGGLDTKSVNVEVVDTMTKAEYDEKYNKASKDKDEENK